MRNDLYQQVFDIIEADRDFVIQLTRDMVRIPTVNPKFVLDPAVNKEPEHQGFLEGVLKELDFSTEQLEALPDRPNLVGAWPGDPERSLIICGHVDVVPEGERELWTTEPYGSEIRDGRIYGRGTLDMKGGIAAGIAACRALKRAGIKLKGSLEIHAVVDEEAGGAGAIDLIRRGRLAKAVLVAETTGGAIAPVEGGLEWVKVTIHGRAAHSGRRYNAIYPQRFGANRPEPGVSAIDIGVRFLTLVRELEREWAARKQHPLLPPGITTINPGVVIGGSGIGAEGRPRNLYNNAIIPDVCVMEFGMKYLPTETSAQVRREFEDFVHHFAQTDHWLRQHPPIVEWDLRSVHFPPVDTPLDHPLVKHLMEARRQLGVPVEFRGYTEVCDAAHYQRAGATCVIYGPGGDRLHGPDEYVDIASLVESAKVMAATIIDWCGVD
ncbi:MAG: ArgE/DapE family deacylase [Alphaproteobacteria bacterium]|nr:ArgE/DapE family deacylase [Alphaproteobacteria bacterium]